jgi:hypothetical protein
MFDAGKVIIGLGVFLVLLLFPVWYNIANDRTDYVPELEKAARGETCVEDVAYMRSNHMDLLNDWRERVVRQGERWTADGVEMSLTRTCLGCHQNKANFCDKCHSYMAVDPYCWTCHVIPEEVR